MHSLETTTSQVCKTHANDKKRPTLHIFFHTSKTTDPLPPIKCKCNKTMIFTISKRTSNFRQNKKQKCCDCLYEIQSTSIMYYCNCGQNCPEFEYQFLLCFSCAVSGISPFTLECSLSPTSFSLTTQTKHTVQTN